MQSPQGPKISKSTEIDVSVDNFGSDMARSASAASAQSASPSGPSVCLEQPEEVETEAKGFWLMVMTVTAMPLCV